MSSTLYPMRSGEHDIWLLTLSLVRGVLAKAHPENLLLF